MNISVTIQSDEKGYFDRECPNEDCMYTFKILMKDWEGKVSDDEVHCPLCGHIDTSEKWWTQNQLDQMQEIVADWAYDYISGELDKSFKALERSTRNNKFFKIKYRPARRVSFQNNPIGQSEEWETEICCEKCGTHYSVIGAAYFCPCCGFNSAVNSYANSMESIRKMLDSLQEMKTMIEEKYNKDTAETMRRSMLESSIGEMVSAFQKFACCKYEELSGSVGRVNDFQIVEKGDALLTAASGKSYSNWLTQDELDFMKLMFQRRHLLEHNNGMVDQKYLDKSGDTTYAMGQRLIVKEADAYRLHDVLTKLGKGILTN